ncbi:MAG: hypothetical protein QNJ85_09015 [Gammaproteobacteria bacterium]|nr:hypothetical protein [Gammaproteobacteria bacterium]
MQAAPGILPEHSLDCGKVASRREGAVDSNIGYNQKTIRVLGVLCELRGNLRTGFMPWRDALRASDGTISARFTDAARRTRRGVSLWPLRYAESEFLTDKKE